MLDHIKTYKAGEHGYYSAHARGTVDVWYDSKRYVYRKPYQPVKVFKRELLAAFGLFSKISGQYPNYKIETFV